MTCLSIGVYLQEKKTPDTFNRMRMSDGHGNAPSGKWDNLRNWGLSKCGCKPHTAGTGKRSSGQLQLFGLANWLKARFHLLRSFFICQLCFSGGPSPKSPTQPKLIPPSPNLRPSPLRARQNGHGVRLIPRRGQGTLPRAAPSQLGLHILFGP